MTFKSMKFRVMDKAYNEAVQRKLFEMGFKWWSTAPRKIYHPDYEVKFLYAEGGAISHGELQSTFDNMDYPEYLLYRGELVEAGGVYPTFDEPQQRDLVLTEELYDKLALIIDLPNKHTVKRLTIKLEGGEPIASIEVDLYPTAV